MRTTRWAVLLITAVLTVTLWAAQKGTPKDPGAEAQLQAAITRETVEGDLKGAIDLYSKLAGGSNRAVAAKALVRMGECYEKLGAAQSQEAQKAYERVVRDFADQKESLAAAQKHLAEKAAPSAPEPGVTVQRIATYSDKRWYGDGFEKQLVSRDGRYLVFAKDDGVYLQDLIKGTENRIVRKTLPLERFAAICSPDGTHIVYARNYARNVLQGPSNYGGELYVVDTDGSNNRLLFGGKQGEALIPWLISPDGRQIAYALLKMEGNSVSGGLYVIETNGSTPRLLYSGEKNESPVSAVWSPDGRSLLVWITRDDPGGNSRLLLLSVAKGSSRTIGSGTGFGQFSPDGRYVSYYRWPDPRSDFHGGIYMVPAEGGKPFLLAGGAASDPRWTPDGKRIIFRDQRPDQSKAQGHFYTFGQDPFDLYSIRVVDGKPEGKPDLMKKDVILPGWLLGATPDGSLYYGYTANEAVNIYVVDLDPATGKAVSKPVRLNRTFVDFIGGPARWSSDGQWLAYTRISRDGPRALMIKSTASGEERELSVSPPFTAWGWGDPNQWFPDNRSLLAVDQIKGRIVFNKVDTQTGKQQLYFEQTGKEQLNFHAALSLDGKELIYQLKDQGDGGSADPKSVSLYTSRLIRRNMDSGEEKELYRTLSPSGGFGMLGLSRDGRQLAFIRGNTDNTSSLLILPADGGEPRELYRSTLLKGAWGWTKDGRHVLVIQSDPDSGMNQLWSVSTENGEHVYAGLTFPVIGGASLHPDGRRFTFVGRHPGQTELWVMKLLPPSQKP